MNRACPYCSSREQDGFGRRRSLSFLRCTVCQSVFPDIDPAGFAAIHARAFQDDGFVRMQLAALGEKPDTDGWSWVRELLPGRRVLEIGPGAGHLLAAAKQHGCTVACTESSGLHRVHLRERWGIEDVYESLAQIPADQRFDSVVMINVIEHVYDVASLLRGIRGHLEDGGRVLISTCNAAALLPRSVGVWWTMFKPEDHVSIPSGMGLRLAAARTGLRAERVWTDELPLESVIGVVAAGRDFLRERMAAQDSPVESAAVTGGETEPTQAVPLRRRLTWAATKVAGQLLPATGLLRRAGLAASLKAVLTTDS